MRKQFAIKVSLILYDFVIFAAMDLLMFVFYRGGGALGFTGIIEQTVLALFCAMIFRSIFKIYRQIWRYGGIQCYIRLLTADVCAAFVYLILEKVLPIEHIAFAKLVAFCCMNTLGTLAIRMVYRFAYKCGSRDDLKGRILRLLLKVFAGGRVSAEADHDEHRIRVAIIGAGSIGIGLAEELFANPKAKYIPRCFIDNNPEKIDREIHGIGVLKEDEATLEQLHAYEVQEVIFAVPTMDTDRKKYLYEYYKKAGFGLKTYDFPVIDNPGKKRALRDFDIEDLLMRKPKNVLTEETMDYYKDKVILITGGGGSIGSEICRQLAKMQPRQLVVVDIYENTAYELQQSIRFTYKNQVDIQVEIVSITNKKGLGRVFAKYRPDICINAAAHKHVPLMEHNSIEAVENNVFGTLNVIQLCEEYDCKRFMMVSTDKAVNPTNVMGATKRVCEMIMQAYSTKGIVKCSATRFGNVLGSAGSVIPLFRRQIAAGGPVTITDKRIIRYFMTIPEASQLVLTSGAMAKNGDLFVLDMGQPVKIYDLAENMIHMSGMSDIELIETGLRPGEKLYEELLVDSENLEHTENELIFIEHEEPVTMEELEEKLKKLQFAITTDNNDTVKAVLRKVVPTFKTPEEVNQQAMLSIAK